MCVNYLSTSVLLLVRYIFISFFNVILEIVKLVFQDFMELLFLCEHLMIAQCLQL